VGGSGGLVDEGEQPADAATRALEDSIGYRAGCVRHLITFQPMAGLLDAEHSVFVGQVPEYVNEPTAAIEVGRAEWVLLMSVPAS
jgi:ADP-ribose pyrophosphatase YjhB (NUDIX family)